MKTLVSHDARQIRRTRSRRGSALVEFAIVFPVFLLVVMGIIEFGWMMRNQLVISNAAREGVRYAALGNSSTLVKNRITSSASILKPALTDSQITLSQTSDTTSATPTYYAWPTDVGTKNAVSAGNLIKVTINYSHQPLVGFFPYLKNRNLTVTTIMARENN